MKNALATACPPKYVPISLVGDLRTWLRRFVTLVAYNGTNPVIAAAECDIHVPNASKHIRLRCRDINFDEHACQERLTFGSVERVHPRTRAAAQHIPLPVVAKIAKEEERLRMTQGAYAGTAVIPSQSIEDDITRKALRTVIGGEPGGDEIVLYRVALRLHATQLQNDIVFLRSDRTATTMFLPGDTVPRLPLRNVLKNTFVPFEGTGVWLFLSAS